MTGRGFLLKFPAPVPKGLPEGGERLRQKKEVMSQKKFQRIEGQTSFQFVFSVIKHTTCRHGSRQEKHSRRNKPWE
jgi:hypothetical protein